MDRIWSASIEVLLRLPSIRMYVFMHVYVGVYYFIYVYECCAFVHACAHVCVSRIQ